MVNYEYTSSKQLSGINGNYFAVPLDLILNNDLGKKRISVFSFFLVRKGLDNQILFSVNHIAKWMGKTPNRSKDGICNRILKVVDFMIDKNILAADIKNFSSCVDGTLDLDQVKEMLNENRFAIIYVDELYKILNYESTVLENDITLLVFAYLRMKIFRRRNKLLPEEIGIEGIREKRKKNDPEVYNCFVTDIANELDLTIDSVKKSIEILEELNLIYCEKLSQMKYTDDNGEKHWRRRHTLFCNTYKREGNLLLAEGEEYYLKEIEYKKQKNYKFY